MQPPELESLYRFYEGLWRIRCFEEQVARLASVGEVPGFAHLSIGQEAVAVGVCAALGPDDYLFTGHRGHGHFLARGSDPHALLAEILGRAEGLCRGRGGSMHLVDAARGILGATGVVSGNLPLALGAAWAARERGDPHIAVVFFGDGAGDTGVFHETLNLASLWQIPLLFVCENNGYAEFTAREEHSRVARLSAFAQPYGIPSVVVDGNDVLAVHEAACTAVGAVRGGGGPRFLECMTYRLSGHYTGDPQRYRSAQELEEWRARDPIARLRRRILSAGGGEAALEAIETRVRAEMERVAERARQAPRPDPKEGLADVYTTLSVEAVS